MIVALQAMRVHQWVKNLLLFVPVIMAHRLGDWQVMRLVIQGFASFCFCASAVYLLNDIFDLESDRQHSYKKNRPIASGRMTLAQARIMSLILFVCGLALGWFTSKEFLIVLGLYVFLTFNYSLALKRLIMADVVTLGLLYALRVLAGGYAAGIAVSEWMLAFSMFLFLSLACVKRYSELRELRLAKETTTRGRGYIAHDLEMIAQVGSACGYISALVLALYIQSAEVSILYSHPRFLWLTCPLLLYWTGRVWILAHRGEVHEDPIVFALRDSTSYLVGAICAFIIYMAA